MRAVGHTKRLARQSAVACTGGDIERCTDAMAGVSGHALAERRAVGSIVTRQMRLDIDENVIPSNTETTDQI